jgi:hypothetical protein
MFEQSLSTGRTTEIVVKESEWKGIKGIDVRKYYNGEPSKKGAFLDGAQAAFVAQALPTVLEGGADQTLDIGKSTVLTVKRFDYQGMEGYSIRKESASGTWGKGIWLNPQQAKWVAEQLTAAMTPH